MSPALTARQAPSARLDGMTSTSHTTAVAAHGWLNAGIVFSVAIPAIALGMAAALLAPFVGTKRR